MLKLGIIGCGAIGGAVAEAVLNEEVAGVRLVAILDIAANRVTERASRAGIPIVQQINDLLDLEPGPCLGGSWTSGAGRPWQVGCVSRHRPAAHERRRTG